MGKAHEGDIRGAAAAAPRSTRSVELSSFLQMRERHQQTEADELQRLGLAPGPQDAAKQADALLAELRDNGSAISGADEDTYRLLVGVLIHDPAELHSLHEDTVAPLENYDAAHDTELVVTLERFLAHHGSTTDTAEAMQLHRHTVGYRLARIHEVCGLSPYESDGRERLSLGLKANRILLAQSRRVNGTGKR